MAFVRRGLAVEASEAAGRPSGLSDDLWTGVPGPGSFAARFVGARRFAGHDLHLAVDFGKLEADVELVHGVFQNPDVRAVIPILNSAGRISAF